MIFGEIPPRDVCRALSGLAGDPRFKIFVGWCEKTLKDSHELFSAGGDTFYLTKLSGACYTVSQILEHIRESDARLVVMKDS